MEEDVHVEDIVRCRKLNHIHIQKRFLCLRKVLIVEGHHRLEAFRQLGYNRVPIKYLHSSQLGKILSDGTYYRSLQELIDAAKFFN